MFDARFFAFVTISALLVISPGATMAVVMETAVGEGRVQALRTVLGVNIANSSLALASALGLSAALNYWPFALQAVKVGGAVYLTWLGARALWRAARGNGEPRTQNGEWAARCGPDGQTGRTENGERRTGKGDSRYANRVIRMQDASSRGGWRGPVLRGVLTNLLNPPVVLFYAALLPQFIGPGDAFFPRFVVLAAVHVSMSLAWLSMYAFALGLLSERLARPLVRRTLEAATGVLLLGFGLRLVLA